MFIYLFWERERESKQRRGRERGRQRIPSRLHAVSAEPDVGLELTNREIKTWAEVKIWTPNRLSHPGTPVLPRCISHLAECRVHSSTSKSMDGRNEAFSIPLEHCLPVAEVPMRLTGKQGTRNWSDLHPWGFLNYRTRLIPSMEGS